MSFGNLTSFNCNLKKFSRTMSENTATLPYLTQLKDSGNKIHLIEENVGISLATDSNINMFVANDDQRIDQPASINSTDADMHIEVGNEPEHAVIYQVVYPEELNLKPVVSVKRGRPKAKKKKVQEVPVPPKNVPTNPVLKTPRTRSGRLVKLPKHIEKDFRKIEITDEPEVRTSEFIKNEEPPTISQNESVGLEFHQRKRIYAAQYRCPKCQKAYLGKNKMIQHLKKYPDHGPLPEGYSELNFDVWNYLVDITQKCSPSQRGNKFCQEITNLLHNVQLLTSALFKRLNSQKNSVQIDKVLGNAIGLPPGKYNFDENELYKDVTVLQLITNSDFFNSTKTTNDTSNSAETVEKQMGEDGHEDKKHAACQEEVTTKIVKNETSSPCYNFTSSLNPSDSDNVNFAGSSTDFINDSAIQPSTSSGSCTKTCRQENDGHMYKYPCKRDEIPYNKVVETNSLSYNKPIEAATTTADNKKNGDQNLVNLLSDNALLTSLPHLRTSVDELMLTGVDTSSNLLDNSTSSDEVMNVDQFVNERFKKITEPDIDLNVSSLNLDLPSLDLFNFHNN